MRSVNHGSLHDAIFRRVLLLLFGFKCFPQHHVLEYPWFMLSKNIRTSHSNKTNSFVYLIFVSKYPIGRRKFLKCMGASTPCIEPVRNSLMTSVLICVIPKFFKFATFHRICYLYGMILLFILVIMISHEYVPTLTFERVYVRSTETFY
jgi:hypothetical protein